MIPTFTRPFQLAVLLALTAGSVAAVLAASRVTGLFEGTASAAQTVPPLTVTGVAPNQSSAKIFYQPVAGARDYRLYDVAAPNDVKYAGMAYLIPGPSCPGYACFNHFVSQADGLTPVFPYQIASGPAGGPQVLNVPATDIEWNGLGDGQPHTLVVEAVDALGPVPQANLYTGPQNTPLAPNGMLGSNKGQTADGNLSTNGQGPFTNNPKVIAVSQAFVVQANVNLKAIPSSTAASQTFYDTFDNTEAAALHQIAREDNAATMSYSLNAGTPKAWTIQYRQANNRDSMPFIASNHFMDMLFDGATPGVAAPTHTSYGSMSMAPDQTLDISGGKVLHMTMEVDAHQSFRRWLGFNLAPAADPLTGVNPFGAALNSTDQAIFLEQRDGDCSLKVFTGPADASHTSPAGANIWPCGWEQMFNSNDLDINGLGRLDSRSRLDFYISQTHAALFEDNKLITQSDIPAGSFAWANQPIKAYFTHYIYHTDADINELLAANINQAPLCYPLNSYWFNNPQTGTSACNTTYPAGYGFPYSDERHWDNMGLEVLPAGTAPASDYSSLLSTVARPALVAPSFVGAAPVTTTPPTASPTPTSTSTSTALPTSSPAAGPNTSTNAATFVAQDNLTQGSWKNVYGSQGYQLEADGRNLPAYAQVSLSGAQPFTWISSTTDKRALQKELSPTDRLATSWFGSGQFTADVNLTDGQAHRVSIYSIDWDSTTRDQTIEVLDAKSGAVIDSHHLNNFHGGTYLTWTVTGHVQLRFTHIAGANAVVSGLFIDPAGTNTATFVAQDNLTQGSWKGVYGSQGYQLEADGRNLPAYAQVSLSGAQPFTWISSTTDKRALQKELSPTDRLATSWFGSGQFTADVNLTDGLAHRVSIYSIDWDSTTRDQTIEVLDAKSGAVIDSHHLNNFHGGTYLTWTVTGHVQLRFTHIAGANAVVSGLFIDTAGTNTATFVAQDDLTQGSWKGVYGNQGYSLQSGGQSLLPSVQLSSQNAQIFTWAGSTTDTRALQQSASPTARFAATWFDSTHFTIDVNLTDGVPHQLSIYSVDWDSSNRGQTIDVLDATGAVLSTHTLNNFHSGTYLTWNVNGHVQLRITRLTGSNAVVSGLFFDPIGSAPPVPVVGAATQTAVPVAPTPTQTVVPLSTASTAPTAQPVPTARPGTLPAHWTSINPPGVSLDFNNPIQNYGFNTIVTDPTTAGTVYLGTNYQGIYKSTDHGTTWVKINTGPGADLVDSGRVWSLAMDPFNHATLYAAAGVGAGGPLKSTDGGVSWTNTLPPSSPARQQIGTNDIYNVAVDPYTPNHLVASFHYFWYADKDSGVVESVDGGATWTVHNPPTGSGWGAGNSVWFLDNSHTWLLGSQSAGYWRTTNSGQTWSQVSQNPIAHGGIYSLYRNSRTGVLYTTVWNGLMKSTDDGVTWQNFSAGLPYSGYETVIGDGLNLYTAPSSPTGGTLTPEPWFTIAESGGTTWTAYNTQTACLNQICNGPEHMAVDARDGTVYSVNWDAGAWRLR